jgi:hypothetical protein
MSVTGSQRAIAIMSKNSICNSIIMRIEKLGAMQGMDLNAAEATATCHSAR